MEKALDGIPARITIHLPNSKVVVKELCEPNRQVNMEGNRMTDLMRLTKQLPAAEKELPTTLYGATSEIISKGKKASIKHNPTEPKPYHGERMDSQL